MDEGYVPGECDLKPLNAQEVNLLQHEHAMLKARVAELEKDVPIDCQSDVERLATRVVELLARAGKAESMLSDIASSYADQDHARVHVILAQVRARESDGLPSPDYATAVDMAMNDEGES